MAGSFLRWVFADQGFLHFDKDSKVNMVNRKLKVETL